MPGVGALKQTSGDLGDQMEQIRREHPDLVLYNGYDESSPLVCWRALMVVLADLQHHGLRYQGIVKALKEGDIQTAQKLQTECNKVIDLLIKRRIPWPENCPPLYGCRFCAAVPQTVWTGR